MWSKSGWSAGFVRCCYLPGAVQRAERSNLGRRRQGGIYHTFATNFVQLASENGMDELEVKTTAGSAANIRLLSENYVQLAIAQEDMVEEASSGTEKNALQILQVNGISERMFEAVHLNYASAAQELKDGEIDAFFLYGRYSDNCDRGTGKTV